MPMQADTPLHLYFHPLSSFCQKAVIALYENDTPFVPHIVDLGDPAAAAALKQLWPIGKFPVLRDEAAQRVVPEGTIIIEYLTQYYAGRTALIPADPELAWQTRLRDRFYDLYINEQMQKIVGDRLRPADQKDPLGVEHARARLRTALDMIETEIVGNTWAMGEAFTMADCAAAPALFYVNQVMPFGDTHPNAMAYFERLARRPSYARAAAEAEPYFHLFPHKAAIA
jgi:glutathione S-transferase